MGTYNRLPSWRVAKILDKSAEGLSYKEIAKALKEPVSTVFKVLEDFPLWHWVRAHRKPTDELF